MATAVSRVGWLGLVALWIGATVVAGGSVVGAAETATPDGTVPAEGTPPAEETTPDWSLAGLDGGQGGLDDTGPALTAGWDRDSGFYISDEEKLNFLLRIGGYLQTRYTYAGYTDRGSTPAPHDQSSFGVPRARFSLGGYVLDPNLNYYIMAGGDSVDVGQFQLFDAYVLYKAGEYFSDNPDLIAFGVGQFKPHHLRQEKAEATRLQFVDRSLSNEFFNIGRSIGIWVQGTTGGLFYEVAMMNGWGDQNDVASNIDQIPAFSAKLDYSILGREGGNYVEGNVGMTEEPFWVVGLSGAFDANNGTREIPNSQQFTAYQFGFDTLFRWSLFSLQLEYVGRVVDYKVNNNVPGMDLDGGANYAHGGYIQGGVFVIPGALEITARASAIWSTGGRPGGNAVEAGPGINWYISRSHRVKLQTDVMFFDVSGNLPVQSERLDTPATNWTSPGLLDLYNPYNAPYIPYAGTQQGVMWRMQLQLEF